MDSPNRRFNSTLIGLKETIAWKVHNVHELHLNNAWTAMEVWMEVGLGATGLTKWNISLHSNGKMLQARAKLISPEHTKVTHHLTFSIVRHGLPSHILSGNEYLKSKEAYSDWPATFWKIMPLDELMDEKAGMVTNDNFELHIQLSVFGADLSENENQFSV